MVYYKTDEEIELIRQSCLLVCNALAHVGSLLRPGVSGDTIDREAETFIRDHGGVPAFKGYKGFPATLCVSLNEQVVHGIPGPGQVFRDGDIVSIDCGVEMNGFFGDSAYTFPIGEVAEEVMDLCRVTKASLYRAIEVARAGNRLGEIGFSVEDFVERAHPYAVVRELVGHGIGRALHESPEVANYGRRGSGRLLKSGLVIAIEPMVNLGRRDVRTASDHWTVLAKDGKPSAHYEHTIAVRKGEADVLSDHTAIEAAILANPELRRVEAVRQATA